MLGSIEPRLSLAIQRGLLKAAPHAAIFYDLDAVTTRLEELRRAFPAEVLHTIAIKACPLPSLLRVAAEAGFGAEAASLVELEIARRAPFPIDRIVFDSPVKTSEEIEQAFDLGVHVNADNLEELDRIARLVTGRSSGGGTKAGLSPSSHSVGVRINPEVGSGRIADTSTAAPGSKFGVSLHDDGEELLRRFERHKWLAGLHVHVGSQGCSLDLVAEGIARAFRYAQEIERRCGAGRIRVFDIGGGLPGSYREGDETSGFADYVTRLQARVPAVFDRKWRVVTEFGRSVWSAAGWAVSRVEYVKRAHGRRVALIHLGADLLVRAVYLPDVWSHEITVHDATGRLKEGGELPQDIGGPLCFAGDLLARAKPLPPIEAGDHIVIHDVGAYTLSMWSRYNSRLTPAVYGYRAQSNEFQLMKAAETVEDVIRFWSG